MSIQELNNEFYTKNFEQFNQCFLEFVEDIKNTFPEYKEILENNYSNKINENNIEELMIILKPYSKQIICD